MNSTGIKIPFTYLYKNITPDWDDIIFGVKNEYLDLDSIGEYAVKLLEQGEDLAPDLLELIWANDGDLDEFMYNYLIKNSVGNEATKEKHLYVFLKWLWDTKEKYIDPLEIIEYIYAGFGYPAEIAKFVKYMPMVHEKMPTREMNLKKLYDEWGNYLEEKRSCF